MKLLKTTLYTFLITATLLSCQKDNEVTSGDITNNTAPSAEIVFKSADSTSVSVMLNYSDKETDLGDLSSQITVEHINSGTTIYTKPITNTGNLKLDNLEAETNYKIYLKVSDGDLETSTDIICSTKKEADPVPVYNYSVNTDINNVITWDDAVNGMVIPAGTVLGTIETTKEVTKDGVVDNTVSTEVTHEYTGEFSNDIEIQGNDIVVTNPLSVDNQGDGSTNVNVANGIYLAVEAKLKKDGVVKATDTGDNDVEVLDGQTVNWFNNSIGSPIYVENTNGNMYTKCNNAESLYEGYVAVDASGSSVENGAIDYMGEVRTNFVSEFAGGRKRLKWHGLSTVDAPKYFLHKQLQQIGTAVDQVADTYVFGNGPDFFDRFGAIIDQLSNSDFEPFILVDGTTSPFLVKIKEPKAEQIVQSLLTDFELAHGATMN